MPQIPTAAARQGTRAGLYGPGYRRGQISLTSTEPGPERPRPSTSLAEAAAVGICGTELHSIRGEWERPTPSVLGHEGAGVVEAVGSEVTSVKPGDEVVLSWAPSCGECWDCRRGRPAACINLHRAIGSGTLVDGTTGMTIDGETLYRGTATGCMQERVTVTSGSPCPSARACRWKRRRCSGAQR